MNNKNNKERLSKTFKLFFIACLGFYSFACRAQEKIADVATPLPTLERTQDDFQERLNSVQEAGFSFIFAFRRKDGDVFSSEDKRFLKENSPPQTNQWVLTADEKAIIAGSNYKFPPENLESLKKRFNLEDYSKAVSEGGSQNSNNAK